MHPRHRFALFVLPTAAFAAACGAASEGGAPGTIGTTPLATTASSTRVVATPPPAPSASAIAAPEAPPAPPAKPEPPPKPAVSTKQFQAWVWERPRYEQNGMIGFFRAGARVVRSAEPYEGKDAQPCGGKWYAVEPAGFVCEGRDGVTIDMNDPRVAAAAAFPARAEPFPYAGYGMSVGASTYGRVPTPDEQKSVEGDVAAWRKLVAEQRAKTPPEKLSPEVAVPLSPVPFFLESHAQAPGVLPGVAGTKNLRTGYVAPAIRLAFLTAFESDGRPFYLTTEHLVVPADRIKAAKLSDFHGVDIARAGEKGVHLPMVWTRIPTMPAFVHKLEGDTLTKLEVSLPYQGFAEIAEDDVTVKGAKYHVLLAPPAGLPADPNVKYVVKPAYATRLDAAKALPTSVKSDEVWVDVNLSKQTLVTYSGLTPTFATLISSGSGGKGHVTPWGAFRVYQKHISSRMSAEEKPEKDGDPAEHAYRYDDVPYVQYVVGGIALHAAFWHEGFGLPRSHGCINLAPRDAQRVFGKTLPAMPAGWHGMAPGRSTLGQGSMVVIHG